MAAVIYLLCTLTCLACAVLLWRGWRQSRTHLLLYSSLCFWGLAASNAILVLDVFVFTEVSLLPLRLGAAFLALLLLLFGLIWEND